MCPLLPTFRNALRPALGDQQFCIVDGSVDEVSLGAPAEVDTIDCFG
jgi:hypothetical protein